MRNDMAIYLQLPSLFIDKRLPENVFLFFR